MSDNFSDCDNPPQGKEFSDEITAKNLKVSANVNSDNDVSDCLSDAAQLRTKVKKKRIRKRNFICGICQKRFHSRIHLTDHTLIHTGERPYKCDICKRGFTQNSNFKRHLFTHTGERCFSCNICKQEFTYKHHFKEHMYIHSGIKPFVCETCGRGFTRKAGLKSHMMTHSETKPFICEVCGKTFKYNSLLDSHKLIHTDIRPFKCPVCEKGFTTKVGLRNHKVVHDAKKSTDHKIIYECSKCQRDFNCEKDLQIHNQKHKLSKSFICNICQKGFSTAYDLKKHLHSCANENPYSCEICRSRFARKASLLSHQCDEQVKSFKCDICKISFTIKKKLNSHLKIHEQHKSDKESSNFLKSQNERKSVFVIEKVSDSVKSNSVVEVFTKNDNFQCEICQEMFTKFSLLSKHMISHTTIKGSVSDKSDSLNEKLPTIVKLNIQKSNFQCQICQKTFANKNSLDEHKLIHMTKILVPTESKFTSEYGLSDKDTSDAIKVDAVEKCVQKNMHMLIHTTAKESDAAESELTFEHDLADDFNLDVKEKPDKIDHFECAICQTVFTKQHLLDSHTCSDTVIKMSDTLKSGFNFESELLEKQLCDKVELDVAEHASNHKEEKSNNIIFPKISSCVSLRKESNTVKLDTENNTKKENIKRSRFQCNICQKVFKDNSKFKAHVFSHTGEKPFICSVCKKGFTQKSNMKKHFLSHTGERRFSCDICPRKFTHKHHLLEHIRLHSDDQSYVCNICGKGFPLLRYLQKHSLKHKENKIHVCEICKKVFSNKDTLARHMTLHDSNDSSSPDVQKEKLKNEETLHDSENSDCLNNQVEKTDNEKKPQKVYLITIPYTGDTPPGLLIMK